MNENYHAENIQKYLKYKTYCTNIEHTYSKKVKSFLTMYKSIMNKYSQNCLCLNQEKIENKDLEWLSYSDNAINLHLFFSSEHIKEINETHIIIELPERIIINTRVPQKYILFQVPLYLFHISNREQAKKIRQYLKQYKQKSDNNKLSNASNMINYKEKEIKRLTSEINHIKNLQTNNIKTGSTL